MTKSPDAFRTISEVADWLGIQAHVLRFWESKFSQVKPVKRAGGRRYYRPADMQLLGGIKQLLYEDGLTIKGVQKILREQGVNHVSALSAPLTESAADDGAAMQHREDQVSEAPVTTADQPVSPAEVANEVVPTVSPEPEIAPDDDGANDQEQLPLPAFTHRQAVEQAAPTAATTAANEDPVETPAEVTAPATPTEAPARPAEPAALVVDAPDPPDEDEIPYKPGLLVDLVKFGSLRAEQVSAAKPLVRALDEWLEKVSGAA
ncbi:MerR family transcriptional regulator [Sedimentitalea todarodis]|uniref:MerR family transcriptional regulator n=1 Tax=Sedimentitalea todarodis TaxID=1631240 RepID=A0ABU3VCB5_9RHOB|nr:MerR family transcriptional regulator [Sedimentitalea todarodis]MDU9003813.1 MerR family transcriptional regulator [Sedimentitalea todarodis]